VLLVIVLLFDLLHIVVLKRLVLVAAGDLRCEG
jgi:hypothetical protein